MAGYFPEMLEPYPKLNRINCQIRAKMGLSVSDPTFLSDDILEDPDKLLRTEAKLVDHIKACGPRPKNPWADAGAPTKQTVEEYFKKKEDWDKCAQKANILSMGKGKIRGKGQNEPAYPLQDYQEK